MYGELAEFMDPHGSPHMAALRIFLDTSYPEYKVDHTRLEKYRLA
jgi:hypothetical protein